jgi:cytochrome oxidase assembly protein ShyY1
VDKHIGYAIQWFSMAAVLILISFFIYIRKY